MQRKVWFVGSEAEVAHHAAPLQSCRSFDVEIVAADSVVEVACPSDLVVFFSEHFDRFRNAIVQLREKRVSTLYLIDGILEWRNAWENREDEPACPFAMRPVLCDKAASIGPSQTRVLNSWGNTGKVETVGMPRLDSLRDHWLGSEFAPTDSKTLHFLVTTAKTPAFTDEQLLVTRQSLRSLKSFFDQNRSIQGRKVKVSWRLTAGLDQAIGVKNQLGDLAGASIRKMIEAADAVVTTPSTAMLEAMFLRRPVALLDFHHCPTYVPAAWTIDSERAIAPVIQGLANPSAARMNFQDFIVSDAMQVAELATARFEKLANAMFDVIEASHDSAEELKFGSNLLNDAEIAPAFPRQAIWSEFEEFADGDTVELQTRLAHARREIEHQKRENSRLHDELRQAHEIFEQIQDHPIAGPVVRLRERFLNLFNREAPDDSDSDSSVTPSNSKSNGSVV